MFFSTFFSRDWDEIEVKIRVVFEKLGVKNGCFLG